MLEELSLGMSIGCFFLGIVFSGVIICLSLWFWRMFWLIFSKASGAKAEFKFIDKKKGK